MNIEIKNISNEDITLFMRKGNIDERFTIPSGQSKIADDYETKTMIIFKRKGLITIGPAHIMESDSFAYLQKDEDENDIKVVPNQTRLEIVEEEVDKYIEDGYIKGLWTDDDVNFLKKNYPTKGREFCANNLNRNKSSVQKKINSLGIKKKKKRKK